MDLKDNVAIVTGAGRGIGKAIAIALASHGARVLLAARTAQEIEAAADEIRAKGFQAKAQTADITNTDHVENLVSICIKEYGRIDTLVNNAGIGFFGPFSHMPIEQMDTMWSVNVRGVFLATRAVLPHMLERKSGCIVTISSLAGKNGVKDGAAYSATKWALRGFASSLMLEVREHNIRVVTIFPGSVDTSFSSMNRRGNQITQPEDVAEAVVFSVAAPSRSMVSEIDIRPTNPAR